MKSYSPLRFPGGKSALVGFFSDFLRCNDMGKSTIFCEPYAGGAGVSLALLMKNKVERILINDADRCIAAFWYCLLKDSDRFFGAIEDCEVSVEAWQHHRAIYEEAVKFGVRDIFQLGFSTFFLNRTNRSGILPKAGMIGGKAQKSKCKIGDRFNKTALLKQMRSIVELRQFIEFTSYDALALIESIRHGYSLREKSKFFIYLDPPYYEQGKSLYQSFYTDKEHLALARYIKRINDLKWLITYDNHSKIRELYESPDISIRPFCMNYSVAGNRNTTELMICSVKHRVFWPSIWGTL